jgi:hypothetical protein
VLYATFSGPYVLVICRVPNGFSSTVSLTLGALGVAISVGASLSTSFTTVAAAVFGGKVAYLGLALVGLCGLRLLWIGMPETHPQPWARSLHRRKRTS